MINFIKNEKYPLLAIFSLFVITLLLTLNTQINILSESAKEIYIPYAIANGLAPYKDIFCDNAPLGYLLSALFLKILGGKLWVLKTIAIILSGLHILATYIVSREFLSKPISVSICTLSLFTTIFSFSAEGIISPNSLSQTILCTFIMWFMYFAIKYIKTKNIAFLNTLTLLFGAIISTNIQSFILILPLIFLYFIKNSAKNKIKSLTYFFIIPVICTLALILMGVDFSDLNYNANFLNKVQNSPSMKYFLENNAILSFNPKLTIQSLINFISIGVIFIINFCASLYAQRKTTKQISITLLALIFCITYTLIVSLFENKELYFNYLPLICCAIFAHYVVFYILSKNFKQTQILSTLILFAITIIFSAKSITYLNLETDGMYYFTPLIICFVHFLNNTLKNNFLFNTHKQCELVVVLLLALFSLIYADKLQATTLEKNLKIKTKNAIFKINKKELALKENLTYLEKALPKNASVVAFPTGGVINFVLDEKYNFYQPNFYPPIVEAFKQEEISKEILNKKPDYAMFLDTGTDKYGKKHICASYGIYICKTILENYNLEAAFGDEFRIYLFKLKGSEKKVEK